MADTKANAKAKATKKSGKKPNIFKRAWNYLRECKGEIKKSTWTHPKVATRNFFVVLVVIAVAGVFIYALDRGLYALLDLVMNMYKV